MVDYEGCCRLGEAVISKARTDYLTAGDRETYLIEQFVRSELFQVYAMGTNPDPDTVLRIWRNDRRKYRAERLRNVEGLEYKGAEEGI